MREVGRVALWVLAIVGVLALARLVLGRDDAEVERLEGERDAAVAVADTLRGEVARGDTARLALLDSLKVARDSVEVRREVVRVEVPVAEAATDSALAEHPTVRALVERERELHAEQLRVEIDARLLVERERDEWRTSFERERGLRLATEAERDAERALAEELSRQLDAARTLDLGLFRVPEWVGYAGAVVTTAVVTTAVVR